MVIKHKIHFPRISTVVNYNGLWFRLDILQARVKRFHGTQWDMEIVKDDRVWNSQHSTQFEHATIQYSTLN